MRRIGLAAVLGAMAWLGGCSGGKGQDDPLNKVSSDATGPSKEEKIEAAVGAASKAPEGVYDIKDRGWDPAKATMGTVGAEMDRRMVPERPLLCTAKLYFEDAAVGNMRFDPQVIKIQDAKTFDIEYALPETKGSRNRVRADGKKRVMLREDAAKDLGSFGAGQKELTEAQVLAFPRRFPETMFQEFIDGTEVWGPLFEAWSRGVGGYEATFGEQSFTQGGVTRSHYRVLAKTEKGGHTEVEVIIDKEKLRPVTVRVNGTGADGKAYKMLWTGVWKVGGRFDAKDFALPKAVPKPGQAT